MANTFHPPKFESEELNVRARLIFLVSVGIIIAALLFLGVTLFAMPSFTSRAIILTAVIFPLLLITLWLVRASHVAAASILLLATIWLGVTSGTILAGSISAPIAIGNIFILTLSGLLMSRRHSIYILAIVAVTVLIIAWAETNRWLPPPQTYSPLERVIIFAFFFVLIMVLQNITASDIARLLRQAHESEKRYRTFLESIPTITYINDNTLDAGTEYISPQVENLLGYPQENFLHDPIFWQKIIHVEDRERVLAETTYAIQTGSPIQIEYRLLTSQQEVIWIRYEANIIQDEQEKLKYWLGVWTDITTRKHAEEEQAELIGVMAKRTIQLQTAAEVSRAASSILDINQLLPNVVELIRNHFDYYYVGIFLLDETRNWAVLKAATGEMGEHMLLAGHRLHIGDSSMVGWCISHGQARIALDVGVDAVRFKNPHLPLTRSEIALPLGTHGEVMGAMTIQSIEAAAFSSVDITALQTMADQVAVAIENAHLFTERLSLINELEKRNSELERFTYTVSHDLRSPLVTIRGFLGYLRQNAVSGDMTRFDKDLGRIANAVDKMKALLNDLLELSRIGRIINMPKDIPFRVIVDETLDLLAGPINERMIKFTVQDDLPTIHGDHTRLVEVLQNLISNAIKFMGGQPNPVIEVGSRGFHEDGKSILFVRDNGIGIEPEYQERVFGLFNRLNPEIEGTGIGLTLVRRIVEVHGGQIWLESKPGEGSTFLFTLPIA